MRRKVAQESRVAIAGAGIVPELKSILKRNAFSHIHAERLTLGTATLVTARKR
jgi:hypothetical protein